MKGKEILTAEAIERKIKGLVGSGTAGLREPRGCRRPRRPRDGAAAAAGPAQVRARHGAGTKDIDAPRCGDAAREGLLLGTSGGGAHALAAIRFNPMEEVLEERPAAIGRRTRGNGGAKAHRAATIKGSKR